MTILFCLVSEAQQKIVNVFQDFFEMEEMEDCNRVHLDADIKENEVRSFWPLFVLTKAALILKCLIISLSIFALRSSLLLRMYHLQLIEQCFFFLTCREI